MLAQLQQYCDHSHTKEAGPLQDDMTDKISRAVLSGTLGAHQTGFAETAVCLAGSCQPQVNIVASPMACAHNVIACSTESRQSIKPLVCELVPAKQLLAVMRGV